MEQKFKDICASAWVVAGFFLLLFFATHGYRFAWDDHSHEVPLLKSFINPNLYPRDFFIQGLRANQPTYFYKILGALIQTNWVEPVYFFLFCISRYFLFFWMYKFWSLVSGRKFYGFIGVISFLILIREEMFLNLTFSHGEFAIPVIFIGLFYFYKNKFMTAAAVLGLITNLHAIYGMFVMMYIALYLLISIREWGLKTFFKTIGVYVLCALPFLIHYTSVLVYNSSQAPMGFEQWYPLYRKYAGYLFVFGHEPLSQTFRSFPQAVTALQIEIYLCLLYIFNVCHNSDFKSNKKNHVIFFVVALATITAFLAGYVWHNKLFLTLSLHRHQEFLKPLLTGFTTIWFFKYAEKQKAWSVALLSLLFLIIGDKTIFSMLAALMVIAYVYAQKSFSLTRVWVKVSVWIICTAVFLFCAYVIFWINKLFGLNPMGTPWMKLCVYIIGVLFLCSYIPVAFRWHKPLMRLIMGVPIIVMGFAYSTRVYATVTRQPTSLEVLRKDFRDMAELTKEKTAVTDLILIPYNMPFHGFRIYSERSIVLSSGDGGIVFFDLPGTHEFERRLAHVKNFRITPTKEEIIRIPGDIRNAVINYDIDYVVFPKILSPMTGPYLYKVGSTEYLALYRVRK